jgi:Peptidase family M23
VYSRLASAFFVAIVVLGLSGCGGGESPDGATPTVSASERPSSAAGDVLTPIVGSVPFAPVPFAGSDGKTHLVYELALTNFTDGNTTLGGLRVLDAESGSVVAKMDAAQLSQRMQLAGSRENADRIGPSQAATVFIHLALDKGAAVPAKLTHEVTATVEVGPPDKRNVTEQVAAVTVDERTLPVLTPPLAGEQYIAADGCCDAVRHTRAVLPVNGQTFLAQRYAIDYEQANLENRIYTGDPKDPKSYVIFGREVLAVADGTVVGTRNDLPEQTPGTYPAGIGIDAADGNFVVLDLGNGFYANYAHMQPGSVRPKIGDKVGKGDVIGLVGNSGNSVAPHLHFHVMDGPSPLAAQGLPYLVDHFSTTGQVASTADFDASEGKGVPLVTVPGQAAVEHTDQLVLDQNIVTFAAPK